MIVDTGLGDTTSTIVNTGIQTGGAVVTGLAEGAFTAVGSGATAFGMTAAVAVPVIGAAIAGISLVVGMWLNKIKLHNMQKTAATKIVDEAAPLLQQNVDAYLSDSTHTIAEKEQALWNANSILDQVWQACSNSQLADAGKRCIAERNRNAGGDVRWDWYSYYVDPISNSQTLSQSDSVKQEFATLLAGTGIDPKILVLGAVGIVGLLVIVGSK